MKCLSYLLISIASFSANNSFAYDTIQDDNVDTLAINLFELFKEQKWDVIVDKYFLNEAECERFDKLILPNKRNTKINYTRDSFVVVFTNELKRIAETAINHNVQLDQLKLISVKKIYANNNIFNKNYRDKLLAYEIYCTDQKLNYFVTIAPLVKSGSRWKVYLTEFNWRQDLK